jgi:hypothetical protein
MSSDERNDQDDTGIDERRKRLTQAVGDFITEFAKESDRAAVILVGARLEYLLGELLSRYLLPNTGSNDELLDTDRALGTFSSRIHAAHRLGLIDADFARALHIFRKLRNTFAHETSGASFDHGPSRDRIRELAAPIAEFGAFARVKDRFFKDKSGTAADFFGAAALLVARLESASNVIQRITPKTFALIPKAWNKDNA